MHHTTKLTVRDSRVVVSGAVLNYDRTRALCIYYHSSFCCSVVCRFVSLVPFLPLGVAFHRHDFQPHAHSLAGLFDHFTGGWCGNRLLIEGRVFLDGSRKDDAVRHSLKGEKDIVVRSPGIFHGVDALIGRARIVDDGEDDLL